MRALIVYMKWLTDEYLARQPDGIVCEGYPPFTPAPGDVTRGRDTFVQKCSFCHGAQGEGRYAGGAYFRPALWGPHSFNACAGLANTDSLGAFIRWNMPYTSGGLLTDQEANDLAAYIDAQCRPGKGGLGPDGEPCPLTPDCVDGVQPGATATPAKSSSQQAARVCAAFERMGAND